MESMSPEVDLPLAGVRVLDFSQFLAGPVAALRLADLGATVVKVERPAGGDIGRNLAFAGRRLDGDTISFHAMNRNKLGVTADLKDPEDLAWIRTLIERSDVLVENFRPGVMDRLGLGPAEVAELNPRLVYASASGYGDTGPWRDRPGQDLLAQSISGVPWLSGGRDDGPVPMGLSVADHLTSIHLAHGVTALLLRRARTGRGGRIQTSLLESMLDLQFELLSTHLNDATVTVSRGGPHSAHAFLPAPYGTYRTADGYLALAMNPVPKLGRLLGLPELEAYTEEPQWWEHADEIADRLTERLATADTAHWLEVLDAADVWCAPVLTLEQLVASEGFAAIAMTQEVHRLDAAGRPLTIRTTRSPLRIDGHELRSDRGAPRLGEHDDQVRHDLAVESGQVSAGR
jgi:CoA:oxalate CoA-transferase